MWQKIFLITLLFYLFSLLQNSFFASYSLFGAMLNLVFVLFFLLSFFEKGNGLYKILFLPFLAGFFLDIFSYADIGPSIVVLLVTAFFLSKIQDILKNPEHEYPFAYFISLFLACLVIYNLLLWLFLPHKMVALLSTEMLFLLIYNALAASAGFWFYKKYVLTPNK